MLNRLFLKRVEYFHGRIDGDHEPTRYIRSTYIPAPGVVLPFILLALSTVWYGVFTGLAVYFLGGSFGAPFFGAAGLLGLNAMVRASLKYRERVAVQAEWGEPVGREIPWVRVASVCAGVLLAGLAGYILCLDPAIRAKLPPVVAVVVLGVIEGVRNGVQIGGRWREDESFDIAEFQTVTRYPASGGG